VKEHEFISSPAGTGGENQKKENHLWFKQKNEHHTMSEKDRKGEIMKKFRKLFAVLTASALVGAMSFTTMAATINPNDTFIGSGSASIQVNLPTLPEGSTATNTYKVYRVFDATSNGTNISYKLNANHINETDPAKKVPAGFSVDAGGNVKYDGKGTELSESDINAIKGYVTDKDIVATVETNATDKKFTLSNLPYGYYYISTTTGTLVTVDSTNPNVTVQDKNEVPTLDKKITGVTAGSLDADGKKALAQVGTTVNYEATITIGKGAEGYVFHDDMGSGLELVTTPIDVDDNDDKVDKPVSGTDYTLSTNTKDDTIYIEFDNKYIGKLAEGTVITISYDAIVTSDALTYNSENGKNTASLDYGHSTGTNSTPIKETKVHNAKLTVTKVEPTADGKEYTPLAGAGFVLKNADNQFYKKDDSTGKTIVTWVTTEADATELLTTDASNILEFTGLPNGTYTLIEKTIPGGYNQAPNEEFTIAGNDYTQLNLEKAKTVVNNKGIELPSTGGMGTVAFAVVGLIVMAGAAITLIIKKRA